MNPSRLFGHSELAQVMAGFRREFLVVGLFSLVVNVLMLAPTLYMLQVYDRVLASRSELTLMSVSMVTLFFFALMAFAEWSRSRILIRAGLRLDALLNTRIFNASFKSNLNQDGINPAKAFAYLTELRQFLTGNGIHAFFDAPWAPVYLAVLFVMHPVLGGVALVFAVIQTSLAWFGHRRAVAPALALQELQLDTQSFLQAKLRNAEVVESMGMLEGLRQRWWAKHQVYMAQHAKTHSQTHRITAWSKWARYTQQSLGLAVGALLVIDGQLTAGAMVASNLLMSRALAPLDQIVAGWKQFITARKAYIELEKLLRDHPEIDPALKRVPPTGELTVNGVVATAPGRRDPILQGVSLRLQPATVTVMIGPSGSGKSTLARVMLGIWPGVTAGQVLLDGRPLSDWNREELGTHIGYLPQDIELFDGTIAENISRFNDDEADKVVQAAKTAGLHDMILRLPKGYDSQIGEAGGMLSGGQRQRIGLARALYGEPALLVLDEPNANLDELGEQALSAAVKAWRQAGRTVVLITHRPSALALADQVVLLEAGQVVLAGPAQTVLETLGQRRAARSARPAGPNAAAA